MCGDIFERILLFSVESLLNISLLNIIINSHVWYQSSNTGI